MGEFDLIATYFNRHPSQGIGDDCAVFTPSPSTQLCVSSDMLVEGRHFLSTVAPQALGHKALAVNLSDLAACGATPKAFTLALALPKADPAWLADFSDGLFALADAHGCTLIGGDTTQGPLNICITVLGEVPHGQAILRSGAQEGDDIYVSGKVGHARLALEVFRGQMSLPQHLFESARQCMERPQPRVALGHALRGVANAAIDVSDGLIGDLGHILRASQVGAALQTAWIKDLGLPPAQSLALALSGGDDYELVFTAPISKRDAVQAASSLSQTRVIRIGTVQEGASVQLLDDLGLPLKNTFSSFDHFQNP